MSILAIETSCDDTCAAVITREGEIRSNVISSQVDHERYGGVVPEVASRHHLELAVPVVDAALAEAGVEFDDLDSVAVTAGPGLIGALLVGLSTAKAIATSSAAPLFRRSAGARLTVMAYSSMSTPSCASAPCTRTLDSRTAASAKPTIWN